MNQSGESQIDQARLEWALRLRYSPFPELSMRVLTAQLNSFRIGDIWLLARTWEIMLERDSELVANFNKRCEDVAALEWEVVSDGSKEGDAHKAALDYLYNNCEVTGALEQDDTGDVSQLIQNIASAVGNRYDIHEMLLRVDSAAQKQVTFEFRHTPIWFFEARRGYLGFLQHVFDVYGQPLKDGEWLAAVDYGYLRACAILYAVKWFPLRDWMLYCARYGFPHLHALTDATEGSPEWNSLNNALAALANDAATITNKGVEIKFLETGAKSDLPFHPLVNLANHGYSVLFRGSDQATSSRGQQGGGGESGKPVGGMIQQGEKDILKKRDARKVTSTLNAKVDRPAIRYLFNAEPKAWIKILPPDEAVDVAGNLQVIQQAVNLKVPVSIQTFRDIFDVPAPKPGDELLEAPVPAPLPAQPGNPGQPENTPPSALRTPNSSGLAPGARPGPSQTPDPGMPGGNKPQTRFNFPGGQEKALPNTGEKANAKLTGAGKQQLAAAVADDLSHGLSRLAAILAIPDDEIFLKKLQEFADDFPKLKTSILADPKAARALQPILAAAFASGLSGNQPEKTTT